MILLYWIELFPVPECTIINNTPIKSKPFESEEAGSHSLKYQDNETKGNAELTEDSETTNTDMKPRVYRLRNWKKDVSNEKLFKKCPAPFDASSIKPMEKIREYNFGNNDSNGVDPTKIYYFPFRQKRSEQWIEHKETRPCKIRNSKSNFIENSKLTTEDSIRKTDGDYSENLINREFDIQKSYSFPIRRKSLQQWIDIQEKGVEDSDISDMPSMRTCDYYEALKKEIRRRRSFSGSEFSIEKMNSSQKHKDFSQSVEISNVSSLKTANIESIKNSPTTFSRLKVGFTNCLFKCKKDNSKLSVKSTDNKKRHFKSFF